MTHSASIVFENTVKIFDSIASRSGNFLHSNLKENIFFLHIPKCGGTSITQALKSCYLTLDITKDNCLTHLTSTAAFNAARISANQSSLPSDTTDDYLILKFRENLLLYYMCQSKTKYIAGHFTFSPIAYQKSFDKFAFITVLRDPIKRWVSAYFYNRYKTFGHRKVDSEIGAYLKSDFGQSQGHEYVKFLGGANQLGDYTSKQAIDRAKENLHKFSVVGCLEYPEDFISQFKERFGRRIKIRVSNQSPKSADSQSLTITEEIKEEIKAVCRPDLELYQYATTNFVDIDN